MALQTILDSGIIVGTLHDDAGAEDIVATIVGMFAATSRVGGREQLERMLDLLMDAIRRPHQQGDRDVAGSPLVGELCAIS